MEHTIIDQISPQGKDVEMYYSTEPYEDPLLLSVYAAGIAVWTPNVVLKRNSSNVCALEMVLEGQGELTAGGPTHTLEPGDIFLLHFKERHTYGTGNCDYWKKIWIVFGYGHVNEVLQHLQLMDVSHVRLPEDQQAIAEEQFYSILYLLRDKPDGFTLDVSVAAYKLLLMIARQARKVARHPVIPAQLARAMHYAQQHMHEELSMDILSRAAGCSRVHLTRLFKKHLGQSTREWLQTTRMNYAKLILDITEKPVYEIASDIGYIDPYHFSAAFHRATGMSPTSFRKQCRSKQQ
jgi:AraC-like DNA-binding protein